MLNIFCGHKCLPFFELVKIAGIHGMPIFADLQCWTNMRSISLKMRIVRIYPKNKNCI